MESAKSTFEIWIYHGGEARRKCGIISFLGSRMHPRQGFRGGISRMGGGIAVADRPTAFCITMCLVYKITIPRLIRPLLSPLPTSSLAHFPTGRRFHGSKARIHAERERSSERRQLARVIDRPVNEAKIFAWREEIRATKRAQTRLRRSVHNLDLCNRNPLAASVDHHSDSSVHVAPSKVGTRSRRDHQGNRNGQE